MRRVLLISMSVLLLFAISGFAQDHTFVGVKKCSMCHKGEKKGMVFEKWSAGPHAKAYATLATEAATAINANAQTDAACLKCHAVGMTAEDGVSCEACHGAGSDYWKMSVMKDRDAAIAGGLVPDAKVGCVTCHNEESPTFKGFDLDTYYAKVNHEIAE